MTIRPTVTSPAQLLRKHQAEFETLAKDYAHGARSPEENISRLAQVATKFDWNGDGMMDDVEFDAFRAMAAKVRHTYGDANGGDELGGANRGAAASLKDLEENAQSWSDSAKIFNDLSRDSGPLTVNKEVFDAVKIVYQGVPWLNTGQVLLAALAATDTDGDKKVTEKEFLPMREAVKSVLRDGNASSHGNGGAFINMLLDDVNKRVSKNVGFETAIDGFFAGK